MKISLKQLASACTVASKAHPEIALGKSQNLRINPSFGSTTEELISGAIDGNTIAQAELARRAAKKNMTIEAFLKGKASSQARREAKQQEKATPIAAAPAPVQQENVVSLQSMQSELQRMMSLIASMAEKKQETPAAVAPAAAAPAPVIDKVLKTNCIKAAMAAIKSEDRAALKAELINLGVIDGSSKMRFSKMVDLFNENFQVKVSKHNAPASTPKVIASANLSVGNIQFTD
jgi:hypothetical protein